MIAKVHEYFVCYTDIGETSEQRTTFSLRSHKRLSLLVDDAFLANKHYDITSIHVDSSKIAVCKKPDDVLFLHNLQPDDFTPIKDKLRYVRLSAEYEQKALADIIGIDRVTLIRLENGDVAEENMKTHILVDIALACGFDRTFCCNRYHTFIANNAGKQIKAYRREHQLTQIGLAEYLKVAHTTVKRWERNSCKPSPDKVEIMFPGLIVNDNG